MEVGVAVLRAGLSRWLDEVRAGSEVVITEHGRPIARLVAVETAIAMERLTSEGVVGLPQSPGRPKAVGRRRAHASRAVSELLSEHRG